MKIKAAIVGANGYGGVELIRILDKHPHVNLELLVSRSLAGQKVSDIFPQFRHSLKDGQADHYTSPYDANWDEIDVCFFATPHTVAMNQAASLLKKGIKVIDLSADFRIKDQLVWEQWYGTRHTAPDLIKQAVYGLPELNREAIKSANLIACPGCYPTSVILGLSPLLSSGLITTDTIIADVKSGISGAGRGAKVEMLYVERAENFSAYASSGHRHLPEIVAELSNIANRDVSLVFTPHLLPVIKGIHATLHVRLKSAETKISEVIDLFKTAYKDADFIEILDEGVNPQTKSVIGTNYVQIGLARPVNTDYLTVMVVEDNLVKGASGQAVQCLNLMYQFEEKTGLESISSI